MFGGPTTKLKELGEESHQLLPAVKLVALCIINLLRQLHMVF